MTVSISIEINGKQVHIGEISDGKFTYSREYLVSPDAHPISISLPLQEDPFSERVTQNFFDGLLPEGFTRTSVAQWLQLPSDDYIRILAGLGKECLGAIQISDGSSAGHAEYRKLSLEDVKALAAEGATKSTEIVTKSHLSLAGASGKVGLYYDEDNGEWYQPLGSAPSTHIVKQSHVRYNNIVVNELLCMKTAKKCGIDVAACFIIETDGKDDTSILLASKRFDRDMEQSGQRICGLPVPGRLHQEDFAQALGVASLAKYEFNDEAYLRRMFTLIRSYSQNPLEDQLKLWDTIIFDYLIGNTDNHLKNYSLIYNSNLSSVRLAPAYDILSTAIYDTSRKLSLRLGDARTLDEVTPKSFEQAAQEVGLGRKLALAHLETICGNFEKALTESAKELSDLGFESAERIKEKILHK